jgi:hypothetical protein
VSSSEPASALYNDAELTALAIVREAVTEDASPPEGYSYSKAVHDHLLTMQERHGPAGLTAVAAAFGRLVTVALTAPAKSWDSLPGFLEDFEIHKMEQHQLEQDEGE